MYGEFHLLYIQDNVYYQVYVDIYILVAEVKCHFLCSHLWLETCTVYCHGYNCVCIGGSFLCFT